MSFIKKTSILLWRFCQKPVDCTNGDLFLSPLIWSLDLFVLIPILYCLDYIIKSSSQVVIKTLVLFFVLDILGTLHFYIHFRIFC